MSWLKRPASACAICPFCPAVLMLFSLVSSQSTYGNAAQVPASTGAIVAKKSFPNARELKAFRNAIGNTESTAGVYGAGLAEQLMGLGLALQQQDRHADAVEVFKRGSHLARINNGLDTAAQIPYLEKEIISHRAMGKFKEVDEAQARLYRVQTRSLGDSAAMVEALLKQGEWQLEAYHLDVDDMEMSFSRLLNMWDINRLALTTVIDSEGKTSPHLLPPLYGMLQTQYLISGHKNRVSKNSSDYRDETASRHDHHRFKTYRERGYDMGQSILRAIYDIQVSHYGERSAPAIQIKIMQADWMLWYGVRAPAMRLYTQAAEELAQLDDAQVQTEKLLGSPVPLPDVDGVRPLLPEVAAGEGNILLEFDVNTNGSVIDLARIRPNEDGVQLPGEASQSQAKRLMQVLHKTKFRPRFVDGEAAVTENIVKAYVID